MNLFQRIIFNTLFFPATLIIGTIFLCFNNIIIEFVAYGIYSIGVIVLLYTIITTAIKEYKTKKEQKN